MGNTISSECATSVTSMAHFLAVHEGRRRSSLFSPVGACRTNICPLLHPLGIQGNQPRLVQLVSAAWCLDVLKTLHKQEHSAAAPKLHTNIIGAATNVYSLHQQWRHSQHPNSMGCNLKCGFNSHMSYRVHQGPERCVSTRLPSRHTAAPPCCQVRWTEHEAAATWNMGSAWRRLRPSHYHERPI